MKITTRNIFWIFLPALFFGIQAAAARTAPPLTPPTPPAAAPIKLSLDQALKLAEKDNPMLQATQGDAAAADARTGMARSRQRPAISATSFLTNGDMPAIISGSSGVMPTAQSLIPAQKFSDQNLMFMLPLDPGGKLSAGTRAAALRGQAAKHDTETTRRDVLLETRMAYYDALLARERTALFENERAVADEQLKNDRVAFDVGKIPAYYLDRDTAELAARDQMLAEARRDAATSVFKLAALLGMDPLTPLELTDTLESPADIDDIAKLVFAPPELAAAAVRTQAAEADRLAARRNNAPDAALTVMGDIADNYGEMDGTMRGNTVALVVSFPLSDGGMRRAGRRETSAMRDAAAREQAALELQRRTDFETARLEFETAKTNINTAGAAVNAAEKSYNVARLRFDAGKGIQVEWLDAYAALSRARINKLQAVRDLLVARAMLLRLAEIAHTKESTLYFTP